MPKDKVIIVDLDGTITAHDPEIRGPYDTEFEKIIQDSPIKEVVEVVRALYHQGYKILYVTGRSNETEEATREWLRLFAPPYISLYMRKRNDFREDSVVKKEIYETHIANHYDVLCVLDDRQQVVDMWRELGLICLQVAPGDF
jgi:uncharacterized HAD superfamily protein